MDLVQSLSHSCILSICCDPCLHSGEHVKDRIRPTVSENKKTSKSINSFGTWMGKCAEFVTIGKYDSATLIYLPSMDAFYYASPPALLSPKCNDKTVFLGQYVVDDDSTPRVLVFDLVRINGVSCADMPPTERYACLQQMGELLGPRCSVQWVGECKVLQDELQSGRFKVPHAVRGVMALSSVPGKVTEVAAKRS